MKQRRIKRTDHFFSDRTTRALGRSGQSLLEVAFMLPFLLLLLLGVIEVGRYFYIGIVVGNAAHAGAMYGARDVNNTGTGTTGIQQATINDYTANGQDPTKLAVSWTLACGCDSSGTVTAGICAPGTGGAKPTCPPGQNWVIDLSVQASGQYGSLFNYPGIPSPITVTRISTLRVMN